MHKYKYSTHVTVKYSYRSETFDWKEHITPQGKNFCRLLSNKLYKQNPEQKKFPSLKHNSTFLATTPMWLCVCPLLQTEPSQQITDGLIWNILQAVMAQRLLWSPDSSAGSTMRFMFVVLVKYLNSYSMDCYEICFSVSYFASA